MPTPAELGYRMPAEWRRHAATWLSWPKDPETWPDRVPQVEEIFLQMMAALAPNEIVNLLVDDAEAEAAVRARSVFPGAENVRYHQITTVDSWIRDYGPNFLLAEQSSGKLHIVVDSVKQALAEDDKLKFTGHSIAYNDWIFNAWGNKYQELKQDDSIPARLESLLKTPRFEPGIVMEGGSIEVNGAGCVLTTEQCLLNPNRNPHLGKDEDDPEDANYKLLQDNLHRLRTMTDATGRSFEIVTLPMPGAVGGESTDQRNLDRLPASYANFYIANGVVLAPVFGHANDSRALGTLQKLFPDRRVVGINCEPLVWGMGTIHCVTQQQPERV